MDTEEGLRFHVFWTSSDPEAGTGHCNNGVVGWSFPAVQLTDIRLCDPYFFNVDPLVQSSTIIHEGFHLNYIAGDWAYSWSTQYSELNLLQQLTNADSFSTLAKSLCP